jgi:opacity protein-like surface antigen
VAPHLLAFGNIGRFNDLQTDLTPSLSAQTAALAGQGIDVNANGALPDGSVPAAGTDVTATLETSGVLLTPARTNAFMYTLGGGVQVPVTHHWAGDLGYRYSRIAADTALSTAALGTNAVTFGFGYRF